MKKIVIICSVVFFVLGLLILGFFIYFAQYNLNGVSHFLVVSIDENAERKYIGKLEGYNVYVERLKDYNFRTFSAKNLSVKKAIENNLVSIDEWKKYALGIKKDNNTTVLLFKNYEITLTGDECLIKPRVH